MAERTADVLVLVAADSPYTSRIPDDLALNPGDLVAVPLGVRRVIGCVWPSRGSEAPVARLKSVSAKLDLPGLPLDLMRLIDWVADYTLAPRGMVLRMALRFDAEGGPGRPRVGVRLGGGTPTRMTPARRKVLATLADGFARPKADAAREAGVSASVIEGLIDDGALIAEDLAPEPIAEMPDPLHAMPTLTPAQEQAASVLRAAVAARAFSVHLLDGVTGSGKTEVYFEAVAEALRAGRQALILLPEIALTARFLDRFAARFGVRPGEWHSAVPTRRRARLWEAVASGGGHVGARARGARLWEAVASGEPNVVAGARSALYLPFRDLGLIVIDEEHDPAYKQEDGVHYHARDMAVVRGSIAAVPVVLASATPSIETEVNARRGRYQRLALPERLGGRASPPSGA